MRPRHRINWLNVFVGLAIAVFAFLSLEFRWWEDSFLWGELRQGRRHRAAWAGLLFGTLVAGLGLLGIPASRKGADEGPPTSDPRRHGSDES